MTKKFIPKKDRWDIYNNLPIDGISLISKKVDCSYNHVYKVLHGDRNDKLGIIKEAEIIAAINIWKTRFCKYKSEI